VLKKNTTEGVEASPVWATLEAFAREQVQAFVQRLLEEEVTDLLGRGKSVRRAAVDPASGSRNGHGRARRLTLSSGTITVRRPRLRGLAERFESRVLPLFQRRTQEVGRLLPELYLHGLALGDFALALRGLLGEGAPLSPSAIARLTAAWQGEFAQWRARSLADLDVVYLWADGLYVKAGLEDSKAALLVVIGALTDGRKVILAVEPGPRESTEAWAGVLRGLHARGLRAPRLTVADGHLGLWGALRGVYPESAEQRCWNHRIVNVLDTVPLKQQAEVRLWLRQLAYAETRAAAERLRAQFAKQYRARHPQAVERLEHDWERLVAYYAFPRDHWRHLRTTNVVESPFHAVRLRTTAAKRFKKVENATALIWKVLTLAERTFRKLNAPHLLPAVYAGVGYVDGVAVRSHAGRVAA
jgi:transposase-like protein